MGNKATFVFLLVLLVSCHKKQVELKDPDYTNFKILKLTLWKMPFQDRDSSDWDIFDGPDVFFDLENTRHTVLFYGSDLRYNDITLTELPLTWDFTPAYEITNVEATQYVTIYDYDILSSNEEIGYVGFTLSEHKEDYPKTITKTRNGITITLIGEWY